MKLHVPHPHAPNMFHRHAADEHQEQQGDEQHHHRKLKEEFVHVKDEISHVVEHTLDTVEHGVDAVDPLHVFSPNEIPTRLVYQEKALSQTQGDAFPIVCARSNDPYHDLEFKATKNTEFVIENATTKRPVMILRQSQEQYDIYTPTPIAKDQQQSDAKGDNLYHYAKVIPSDKSLYVYLNEESDPAYVISKAGLAKSYSTGTKHVFRHYGEKKKEAVVATTQPWQGTTDMLEVQPGENVLFMYFLALIADEMLT